MIYLVCWRKYSDVVAVSAEGFLSNPFVSQFAPLAAVANLQIDMFDGGNWGDGKAGGLCRHALISRGPWFEAASLSSESICVLASSFGFPRSSQA